MINLKRLLYTVIIFLFLGCGTVQVQQENNSSVSVLGVSNSIETIESSYEEVIEDKNITIIDINSSNISTTDTEEETTISDIPEINISDDINESIATLEDTPTIDSSPTVEDDITPLAQPEPEEEPKDYRAKFINENNCSQVLDKEFLVICYDYTLKVARAVTYTLEGDLVNELNIQERPSFYEEELIDEPYRAKYSDYTGSGYDRGHMAPDAAFDWSQESLEATYSLANIIPQAPKVNRYMWVDVEAYARDKAVELGEVEVVNVVKYDSNYTKYIGEDNISVSVGYYKILFNKEESYEECFYYANDINSSTEGDNLSKHKVD